MVVGRSWAGSRPSGRIAGSLRSPGRPLPWGDPSAAGRRDLPAAPRRRQCAAVTPAPRRAASWHRPGLWAALLAALVLVVVATAAYLVTLDVGRVGSGEVASRLPAPPRTPSPSPRVRSLAEIAQDSVDRVVTIEVAAGETSVALGTGWLLDGSGDYVTNQHVVSDQRGLRIVDHQGGSHPGQVMGIDLAADVAVVRAQDGYGRAPLPADGNPDPPVPEPVVVLASSRATGHGDRTEETLVRLHQSVPLEAPSSSAAAAPGEPTIYADMLVLKGAVIYRGNSGGPVLDQRGVVIGIVTLASDNEATPQAFAIPVGRVLDELRAFAARNGSGTATSTSG